MTFETYLTRGYLRISWYSICRSPCLIYSFLYISTCDSLHLLYYGYDMLVLPLSQQFFSSHSSWSYQTSSSLASSHTVSEWAGLLLTQALVDLLLYRFNLKYRCVILDGLVRRWFVERQWLSHLLKLTVEGRSPFFN